MADIVIWDCEGTSPKSNEKTILWRDFSDNSTNTVSIPSLIEEHSDEIKSTYLNWIYELGELSFNGKSLIKHLELQSGISYWWMLPISEKCNFSKSPNINDAIGLIAFFKWAETTCLTGVRYYGSNKELSISIELWCKNKKIPYIRKLIRKRKNLSFTKLLYLFLPNIIQAIVWVVLYICRTWPLRNIGLHDWKTSTSSATFISYLFNFDLNSAMEGKFESAYWGTLPETLLRDGLKTNWLHLYINNDQYSCSFAAKTLRFINKSNKGLQNHVALESFMSFSVILKALTDWMRLTLLASDLEKTIIKELNCKTLIYLWPLFSLEWKQSMAGQIAFENTLSFHLFDAAFKATSKKNVGVFLQENQGWEFGFTQAWKKNFHGTLFGFPHSTVRFWDLRYFFNPKSYQNPNQSHRLPIPDFIATNGTASKMAFIKGGYPVAKLMDVESLRHLYLENIKLNPQNQAEKPYRPIKVLVMGDYLPSNTLKQMELLKEAADFFSSQIQITIKKHPANPELPEICLNIDHITSDDSIEKLLINCDIAYSSSVTSAAVDAYCTGIPLISVLDPNILNLSPLREQDAVYFIKNSHELISAILELAQPNKIPTKRNAYFTIDKQLPRWRKVLKYYASNINDSSPN